MGVNEINCNDATFVIRAMHQHLEQLNEEMRRIITLNEEQTQRINVLINEMEEREYYSICNCYLANIEAIKIKSKDCLSFIKNFFSFLNHITTGEDENGNSTNCFKGTWVLITVTVKAICGREYRNVKRDGFEELKEIRNFGRIEV